MPWTFLGFVLLVLSILLWVAFTLLPRLDADFSPVSYLEVTGRILGLLGAGLFALGLSTFARARRAGPGGRWLDVALILWFAELGLRIVWLVGTEHVADFTAGLRVALIAGAIVALASWMSAVWRNDKVSRVRTSWGVTRIAFLLQIAGVALLASVPGAATWIPERLWFAAVWIAFVAPWVVLYFALRSTMRELGRQHSLADVLTS